MTKHDLEPREVFERIAIACHSEISGSIRKTISSLENYERTIRRDHPQYYILEVRLGYDWDNRAQVEIFGRRKETQEEVLKRVERNKKFDKERRYEECRQDTEAFERLKERHPELIVKYSSIYHRLSEIFENIEEMKDELGWTIEEHKPTFEAVKEMVEVMKEQGIDNKEEMFSLIMHCCKGQSNPKIVKEMLDKIGE